MSPLKTEQDYATAKIALLKAFRKGAPHLLTKNGAPADEYDQEIATVLSRAKGVSEARALATILAEIFTQSFGDKLEASDCLALAEISLKELTKVGVSL